MQPWVSDSRTAEPLTLEKIEAAFAEMWKVAEAPPEPEAWLFSRRGWEIFQHAVYVAGRQRGGRWRAVRRWRQRWARTHATAEVLGIAGVRALVALTPVDALRIPAAYLKSESATLSLLRQQDLDFRAMVTLY